MFEWGIILAIIVVIYDGIGNYYNTINFSHPSSGLALTLESAGILAATLIAAGLIEDRIEEEHPITSFRLFLLLSTFVGTVTAFDNGSSIGSLITTAILLWIGLY